MHKTQRSRARRCRGSVLCYALFMMTIMFAMISLAVDFGRMEQVKTELQRCADATAAGCIQEYITYGSSVAAAYANTIAADNPVDAKSGVSPTVSVTWGYWNSATNSFIAGTGTPVAVKVIISRTTQTHNPVPLTFPLISDGTAVRTTCDVWASSVATSGTQTLVNYPSGFSGAAGISMSGSSSIVGTHLRLTAAVGNEAGSGWFGSPVPIGTFSTSFQFQLTSPSADGMAFVIQNTSKTALGAAGGGLGYAGLNQSVCVKFDLYNNAGEGVDSTGVFTNGANPYTPSTDMTSTGVNLHSGHVMNVNMSYVGTTLTWVVTDTTTDATGTFSQAVNIPSVVGSSTAYVGFTGGTGGATAQQDVLSWTYSSTGPVIEQ